MSDQKQPIDRFNDWYANGGRDFFRALLVELNLEAGWLGTEIRKMRSWIMANPKKGNKKLWNKFASNWVNNALSKTQKPKGRPMKGEYHEHSNL